MSKRITLTKKEKAFCEEYIQNGGNAAQAYRFAYGADKVDSNKVAYKVLKRPLVREYITELQKEAFAAACINAERIALKLAEIGFAAKGDEDYNAAAQLKALDLLQKQLGLQTQKVEADVKTDINITIGE